MREVFDGLKTSRELSATMIKGSGQQTDAERVAVCFPRTGRMAKLLGPIVQRSAYTVEQLSSFPFVANYIRRVRPDVVFYHDAALGFQLYRWRRRIGVPFRLLFSNGGPCRPPFDRTDFVHHAAPYYFDQAIRAGEEPARHFMIPQGISLCDPPVVDAARRRELRERLGIPAERPVVLSVGWISREHKRMHYVIEELSRLRQPRPFLQMLGEIDDSSRDVLCLAENLLGAGNYSARSVPYHEVSQFYRAADVFVLASLQEGFGRVYVEALMHGLPVLAHRHPVMEYVLGEIGHLGDFSRNGNLTEALGKVLLQPNDGQRMFERWTNVRDRFSWNALAPKYVAMLHAVAK